jgi:hypothetical protein
LVLVGMAAHETEHGKTEEGTAYVWSIRAYRFRSRLDSLPSIPSWFGEVAVFAHCLTHEGILKAIQEQVRFARARMGTYELIDFVAVVIGYVLSGEPTLQAFYERLALFAEPFMRIAS